MANLVYKRCRPISSRPTFDLVLAEAGIEDPIVFEEQAGTSSRLHPLEHPKFGELLHVRAAGRHRVHPRNRVNALTTDTRR